MSEEELVQQLKGGTQAAFEELVRQYAGRLYSVSVRILRNPQDAEDAVQDTFLKVLQSIDSFREESSLYTWLYRIVTNEALSKLRKSRVAKTIPIEPYLPRFEDGEHAEPIADWSKLPDLDLEAEELGSFFEQCVDELPDDHRVPYILKDVEQLSERQVCEILRLSKPAMKSRVHRARLVIRKRIEERFFSNAPA